MAGVIVISSGAVDPVHEPIHIHFCELLLRDGIQGWPSVLPTETKLALLRAIDSAGVREIDVTSFLPSQYVPQFSDAEDLLERSDLKARVRVLTANPKGVSRVIEAHRGIRRIDVCGMPFSASERHNIANLKCDHATQRERIGAMVEMLSGAGITPMVCIATAWGCPLTGLMDADRVLEHAAWLRGIGVRSVMLGDTTGMADPGSTRALFARLLREFPDVGFIAHFHDNRGCGIANTLAAIEAGVRSIDGCIGGLGGEPAIVEQGFVGESGNVVSEDLLSVLHRMGMETGVDDEQLLAAGRLAESVFTRPLFSKVLRAGQIG